jgi:hypothetical protein
MKTLLNLIRSIFNRQTKLQGRTPEEYDQDMAPILRSLGSKNPEAELVEKTN